jgi:pimeloyl-ACP methyl ester carboxylesterase
MPNVNANGIRIEYDSFGTSDAAPILLIAGLGEQKGVWTAPFCEILAAKGFWVIRFDNRDAGLSSRFTVASAPSLTAVPPAWARADQPDLPYRLHDMGDDAVGLLDAIEIKQAHLVGRSMGGMIAQLIASEYPERTLSLTAILSSSRNPAMALSRSRAMPVLTQHAPHPSRVEPVCLDPSVRTLVIHGKADRSIPLAMREVTAASMPRAEFKGFEGMGHEIPSCLYESIAQAIENHANFERFACDGSHDSVANLPVNSQFLLTERFP